VTAGGDLPMMTSENNYTQPERLDFERCLSVLGLDADDWGAQRCTSARMQGHFGSEDA